MHIYVFIYISTYLQVRMDFIILDPAWPQQKLSLSFRHVDNVTFHQLHVDTPATVSVHTCRHGTRV